MTLFGGLERRFKLALGMIFPESLFQPGIPGAEISTLLIERLPLDQPHLTSALTLKSPISLVLAPSLTLERRITLPEAASRHAENAIALELRQSLPAQAQGLVWSAHEAKRAYGKVEYSINVVKEAPVLQLLHDLKMQGVRVAKVFAGKPGGTPVWTAATKRLVLPRVWFLIGVLIVAIVAAAEVMRIDQQVAVAERLVETRQERVAGLEQRLLDFSKTAEEAEALRQLIEQDAERFSVGSQRLQVLTDLSNLLPDTVWISELTIADSRLSFSGFSRDDITAIVTMLQAAPWAASVALEGSITYDAYSEQSRFMIAIDLVPLGVN